MPIYEFECPTCGDRFDRLQKLSDPDPEACPQCGAGGVRRCVTAPSFRLAGSGWYETDFKKEGDKKRNLADKPEAQGDAAKSDTAKTDAKPASDAPATKPQAKSTEPAAKPAKAEKPVQAKPPAS